MKRYPILTLLLILFALNLIACSPVSNEPAETGEEAQTELAQGSAEETESALTVVDQPESAPEVAPEGSNQAETSETTQADGDAVAPLPPLQEEQAEEESEEAHHDNDSAEDHSDTNEESTGVVQPTEIEVTQPETTDSDSYDYSGTAEQPATTTEGEGATTRPSSDDIGFNSPRLTDSLVNAILTDISQREDIPFDKIKFQNVEEITWNDGSLGCPQPDMMYTQALIDGLRLTLVTAERTYIYHSDSGTNFILCEKPNVENGSGGTTGTGIAPCDKDTTSAVPGQCPKPTPPVQDEGAESSAMTNETSQAGHSADTGATGSGTTGSGATTRPSSNDVGFNSPRLSDELLKGILTDISQREDIPFDKIKLQNVEEITWNDGSLGCPQPDMIYTQALIDGLRLTLATAERTYIYHSDSGTNFILCEKPNAEAGTGIVACDHGNEHDSSTSAIPSQCPKKTPLPTDK